MFSPSNFLFFQFCLFIFGNDKLCFARECVCRYQSFSLNCSVFSITWLAAMQIYWSKRKFLHKKTVQLPRDWFGTQTWLLFHNSTLLWGGREIMWKYSMVAHFTRIIRFRFVTSRIQLFSRDNTQKNSSKNLVFTYQGMHYSIRQSAHVSCWCSQQSSSWKRSLC